MTSNPSASLRLKKNKITDTNITLSHGSGGRAMRDLINEIFVNNFDNNLLATLEDQARFEIKDLAKIGNRLAFTTDSYVVSPLFFPGGDIGSLAVNGTVN
ncbi:MAG: hydrogenase expression/formation protein HypE, partial [Microcystis panniformis]